MSNMYTEWLAPIPEKHYVRIVYLGKLRVLRNPNSEDEKIDASCPYSLEEMIKDIWKKASIFNSKNYISGHLACSKSLHVVQLLEGREKVVTDLMKRIRRDPRVEICMEFKRKILSMNVGWGISMCYSFDITNAQLKVVQRKDISLKRMFDMMKKTSQALRENLKLHDFYKSIIETMLLKYISITKLKVKVLGLGSV